jgi:hypothetical protein
LKTLVFLALLGLSACSWFHPRPKALPDPPELIVTGAQAGSTVFIDNVQNGQAIEVSDKPRVLTVGAGEHVVEVRKGSVVVYREQTYVGDGERRVIHVLSGSTRE